MLESQKSNSPSQPLTEALAPFARLVQLALNWFVRNGHRHSAPGHRAIRLPASAARRLVEAHLEQRVDEEESGVTDHGWQGGWCAGTSPFFAASSSRAAAIQRCLKHRCNTLLIIRPDDHMPCYPVRMQLKDSDADDVLYPLGVLFRVRRASRMVSAELASDIGLEDGGATGGSQWPVTVIELASTFRFFETIELLEYRGPGLGPGSLETLLELRIAQATSDELSKVLQQCGETLENCPGSHTSCMNRLRAEQAMRYYDWSVRRLTNEGGDMRTLARSLLGLARGFASRPPEDAKGRALVAVLGEKAIEALEASLGADHPETQQARNAWLEIKFKVTDASAFSANTS